MIWISVFAAIAALRLRALFARRLAGGPAALLACACYGAIVLVAGFALPTFQDVPRTFPPLTLWEFREASLGVQAVLWATIGLVFAGLAQRAMTGRALVPWRDRTAGSALARTD
jgi:hypothetical protein